MNRYFLEWPFHAVNRLARLLRRQGKGIPRSYSDTERYPKNAALVLIKNTLKRWFRENPGFCILIGGPRARTRNVQSTRHYVRSFCAIQFRNPDVAA